jgi:glycosyltransferase involved in cell wall biosynthesis
MTTLGPSAQRVAVPSASPRIFDGVVCFGGEDWWYHNRGHFDMQMMREFSGHCPVLYVNSIGMRVPRVGEGKMFFRRVARKLRSLRRGLVRVRPNFAVLSPFVAPGRTGMAISRRVLPGQVRRGAARIGVNRPLVWVNCPPGVEALDGIGGAGLVYQRTDRYESFKGVDHDLIRGYDLKLKAKADVTLFCSRLLFDEEKHECRHAIFVDHGVDFEAFALAGAASGTEPDDIRPIPRPRVGFVGGIDSHTFDPELFVEVARLSPQFQFVLVGACSLPPGWCTLPNVTLLGQRPYEQVPAYMAACDVLIMPWNQSPWIKACNPVKMKEYLAVGRPVVSTPFDELRYYQGFIEVAADARTFAGAIAGAVALPGDPDRRRERVRDQSWGGKAETVLDELSAQGLVIAKTHAHG